MPASVAIMEKCLRTENLKHYSVYLELKSSSPAWLYTGCFLLGIEYAAANTTNVNLKKIN